MTDRPSTPGLVGRESELARLRTVLDRAVAGESGAMILVGAPGIGKTALTRAAVATARGPLLRLNVNCLPLQALSTGLTPLRTALRASSASADLTRSCLARMDQGDPIRALDDWVDGVVVDSPLAIVVDDLQWADAGLRDVVLYLLAGPPDRPLALLVTVRTSGLPDGHPVHGWLADAVRLPRVGQLPVTPLDRAGTDALLAALLGGPAHQTLVDDVFRAAQGNPYLTSLLTAGVHAADRHLPVRRSGDLVTAVQAVWHACSPPTRTLCCLLAVGGAPEHLELLQQVAGDLDLDLAVVDAVREAETAGLLRSVDGGRTWFHHPLQAEVLERSVSATERRHWLAAYARRGDDDLAAADLTLDQAIVQCVRHDRAGSPNAAYRWAVRAAELGRDRRGTAELRRVLRRAVVLRPEVTDSDQTADRLWRQVRTLAAADGAYAEELEAVEALLRLTDEAAQPLRVSELLVRRKLLRLGTALEFLSVADVSRAIRLAEADQSSAAYALALAEAAHVGFWRGDPEAAGLAARAVAVGRAAAEPFALSYALTASVITLDGRWPAEANRLAAEAVDAAVAVRDWLAFVYAVVWESNAHREPYGPAAAADVGRRREQLLALGGPDPYLAQLATVEAEMRLELGEPDACERLLRETLVSDLGPMVDVWSRSIAARLAVYQGRVAVSLGLLSRVDDLVGGQPRYRGVSLDVTRVYVLIAAGRPAEAYAVALAAATDPGVPVHMAEYLVPQAAQALADQMERARDHHEPDEEPRRLLKDLHDRFPTVIDPEDSGSALWNQRIAAMQAWYDAETARAYRDPEEAARWMATRSAATAGLLPWLELYAGSRGAEAILRRGRTGRPQGVRLLRDSHELAGRLGAEGQQAEIEELARQVRVDLGADRAAVSTDAPELSTLTPRERELLSHLTAGLTYAEIAEVLVISEKTVSSHVSNLLRKTGTTGRVELARLVARITR